MWYKRNCDLILLMTGCCDCSVWACWQLRENISTMWSSCTRFFSDCILRKAVFLSSLFRSASIVIWYCLTDESARAFNSLAVSLGACFGIWFALIFCEERQVLHFFLGKFPVNWVHVKFILRPLRRALVLVICAIHIFIANCLNLLVSLNCIFSRLPTSLLLVSSDSPSSCTNEVSCTEELNRIPALVSLKTGSICLKELRNYNRKLYLWSPQK